MSISFYDEEPIYYLKGIVSYGSDSCGIEGIPAVYTKVTGYLEWISNNVDDDSTTV